MKEGWTYKMLGEVCEILDSQRKPITKGKREPGSIPYYGATGCLDYVKDYIFDEKLVLLGEDGAKWGAGENSAYIINGKSWVNNHAHALRPKRDLLVDELLVYYLNYSNLLSFITGVTVPKLNQEKMRSIEIPIGPVEEQKSIVDYLDSAFAKIDAMKANAEKALGEANALFQASLKEMLEPKEGWEEKKLGDIGELKNGMNFNKNESGYNVHILGVGDFGNLFQINDTDHLQTISLNSNPSAEYILKNEDIVFVRSNGNKNLVGRCVLIHVGDEPCSFSGFCIRLRKTTNEVDANYLIHFLKTEDARKRLVGNGANISNLNQKVLNEFIVLYPSIQEQQSIVATLNSLKSKVDCLQENFDKISQECDALKQAILRQVFE